jgi:hypothetical protein
MDNRDNMDNRASNITETLSISERRSALYELVDALPPKQRQAILLYLNGDMPSPMPNDLKQAYHNGRKSLKLQVRYSRALRND